MGKRKPKTKTKKPRAKSSGPVAGKSRKSVDLASVRKQISNRVGKRALDLVQTTIEEVKKGQYGAMKYLFEMIGLYPVDENQAAAVGEDALAKTLLKRLGLPEDAALKPAVTKDSAPAEQANDAVE